MAMFALELGLCFVATIAFAIIFNIPLRLVWWGGVIGVCTWAIYSLMPVLGLSLVFAAAVAAFFASFVSQWFARFMKVPVTTFSLPGIIPLIPGSRAYETMLAFVQERYLYGLEQGVETVLQAIAIAAGLVFAFSVFSVGKGVGQRYETHR
ncbi:threonine/serine exporter family protein [Marinococcus sp. PL1-022]|jgi:uncharacterized membrane protein YjjB (DUF3815 family)|uniref:threonine/serine exporter family protein n=1 Tax=Marinococcus sp. PL1-022 TaxID=3095363 RepID=UPI002631FEC3|nr:threonine/serine exporter family protein [Marinococcus sp. PL1-022]MDX6154447.1 threonine/serine exporter family protein [Marinococcus sp. PL1-022]